MVVVFILIAVGVIGLAIFLYKILLEETSTISKEKEKEKEEETKRKNSSYLSKIEKEGIENILNSIKDSPDEKEKMQAEIQKELRKSIKSGNTAEMRKLQGYLTKIDNF